MYEDHPAFGRRLAELAEPGVIEFRPESFDAIVERRLKTTWEEHPCPNCGADSLQALNGSDRIWCGRCDWKLSERVTRA
jgi:ribosomal protein S27AE